jgi:hypothetical protein
MDLLQNNPFTTIKANDLNDSEINEQWVDNPQGSFIDIFCPKHKVSQYIIGGKGSGKTHLMRYFSHNSQSIRNKSSVLEGIKKDGYFGIYFQASGLNGERFESLPFDDDKKNVLFQYSYELWSAGLTIQSLIDIETKESVFEDQEAFCSSVLSLFSKRTALFDGIMDLQSLKSFISKLSNEVDYAVSNAFFIEDFSVEVLASRGSLIFGIPKLLSKYSLYFKDVTFLYIIDELENISTSQQIYINTLLREKKLPCSFRIGARSYGLKTFETLGSGEVNRQGHEYEIVKLDDLLSEASDYENFAINLIINRLEKSGFISNEQNELYIFGGNTSQKKDFLNNFFERPSYSDIIDFNDNPKDGISKKLSSFKKKLNNANIPNNESNTIITNLSENRSQLAESALIHLFSQFWSSKSTTITALVSKSQELRVVTDTYLSAPKDKSSLINKKISHYKNNYIASSLRIKSQNNMIQYLGLDNLFKATTGFPRHILTVLRNIYKTEIFEGGTPFINSNRISIKSQRIALLEASNWFHNEIGCEGLLGGEVSYFLSNLCEILRIEMYADKPVECSASSFTVDETKLTTESREVLRWAELTGVLVKGQDRQDKNSQAMISKYHVNSLLCPKWGLSLSRRGAISFTPRDFEALVIRNLKKEFETLKNKFEHTRNAPFDVKYNSAKTEQLDMGF